MPIIPPEASASKFHVLQLIVDVSARWLGAPLRIETPSAGRQGVTMRFSDGRRFANVLVVGILAFSYPLTEFHVQGQRFATWEALVSAVITELEGGDASPAHESLGRGAGAVGPRSRNMA